ncbi:hypothetical protein IFM89_011821 [Coptis chinensis]|uniref:TORTIFOLIA1/SINE1-2 N-terminal domain-containing protein n=1 Tax=Coptis chinensis TaxID=261450 RepID=A0A835H3R5_9MAGN|nr:hypothetical protein IFM89_011821 [Coptis chinensis]
MGRNLSPAVQRELENLDKDAESRKLAMKALKSYVKDLDSNAIPQFLAQVSETKAPCSSHVEHTISLYEVLARVHGSNIVPQINNIMSTIIKTLTSSAGSFPLQQACSKVVPAIARYGIDPTTPLEKKGNIIYSLCKPLSDCLLGSQESLAFGAALCLKALLILIIGDFASDELVNEVCLRVAGALEENVTQTNSHMGLAMALAKHNSFTVEAYARSLIRSGLRILNVGAVERNSQKRLSAIQMVNFLMKSLDVRSIFSELDIVIEELEKCHSDQMAFVKGAAFEALQTAKMLMQRKDQKSQTVDSFIRYNSFEESPMSTGQVSCNFSYGGRSVSRKLWGGENGGVDVSLKDGLYSGLSLGGNGSNMHSYHYNDGEISDTGEERSEEFSGFMQATPRNREVATSINRAQRSTTPSPQRRSSQINIDNVKIFTTPRKLLHSLQDLDDENSDYFEEQARRIISPCSSKSEWSPTSPLDGDGHSHNSKDNGNRSYSELGEQVEDGSESVSSVEGVTTVSQPDASLEIGSNEKSGIQSSNTPPMVSWKNVLKWVFGLLFILLAFVVSFMWSNNAEEGSYLPPT